MLDCRAACWTRFSMHFARPLRTWLSNLCSSAVTTSSVLEVRWWVPAEPGMMMGQPASPQSSVSSSDGQHSSPPQTLAAADSAMVGKTCHNLTKWVAGSNPTPARSELTDY